jgi:hypothetical protein
MIPYGSIENKEPVPKTIQDLSQLFSRPSIIHMAFGFHLQPGTAST